jgi:hypothetical protein
VHTGSPSSSASAQHGGRSCMRTAAHWRCDTAGSCAHVMGCSITLLQDDRQAARNLLLYMTAGSKTACS